MLVWLEEYAFFGAPMRGPPGPAEDLLWPEPSIGLNPSFAKGGWINDLVAEGVLYTECGRIFRVKRDKGAAGSRLRLHRHQLDAIHAARAGRNCVLTTGTGSGKSLAYIVPIVDAVLRGPRRPGIKAIVVYPMNALANSQDEQTSRRWPHSVRRVAARRRLF